ncbi:MAG: hypothetical protein GFGODING_01265 [Flavobacteriales bacterium]|nr:hypothetical protein [Flavobacteriales bacterium]
MEPSTSEVSYFPPATKSPCTVVAIAITISSWSSTSRSIQTGVPFELNRATITSGSSSPVITVPWSVVTVPSRAPPT